MDVLKHVEELRKALWTSVNSYRRSFSALILSAFIFLLFAFSTDIPWHLETLQRGIMYWDNAFLNAIAMLRLEGNISFYTTIFYSILGGMAINNLLIQLGKGSVNLKSIGGILPGFLAAGCASCGVGLAAMLGVAGATAALPFRGLSVKVLGIVLLGFSLVSLGHADLCKINDA